VTFFRENYGPVTKAFQALGEKGQQLQADLAALAVAYGRPNGPSIAIPAEYLEAIVVAH
jgi:hypothetical protein